MKLWILLCLAAAAALVTLFLLLNSGSGGDGPLEGRGEDRTLPKPGTPEFAAKPQEPLQETTYEVLRMDWSRSRAAREYAPAPCEGCLDEREAIEAATAFLDQQKIEYMGELRAEIMEDFPWQGNADLWWHYNHEPIPWENKHKPHSPSPPPEVVYAGEDKNGQPVPPSESPEHVTWRVWYQIGWLNTRVVEVYVDEGRLPLEALAWPPVEEEDYILVHARTRVVVEPLRSFVEFQATPTVGDQVTRARDVPKGNAL